MKTGLRIYPESNMTSLSVDGRYFKTYTEHGTRAEALRIAELWRETGHTVTVLTEENGIADGPYTLDELRQAQAMVLANPDRPDTSTFPSGDRFETHRVEGTTIEIRLPEYIFVRYEHRNSPNPDLGKLGYLTASVWYVRDPKDEGGKYLGSFRTDRPALWTADVAPRSGGVKDADRTQLRTELGTSFRSANEAVEAIVRYHRQAGTIVD